MLQIIMYTYSIPEKIMQTIKIELMKQKVCTFTIGMGIRLKNLD